MIAAFQYGAPPVPKFWGEPAQLHTFLLDFEGAELELPFHQIQRAKLTLPEEIFNLNERKK